MPRALNAWVQEEIERWSFDGLGRCGKGKKTGWKWMLWVVRFVKILSLYHFLAFFRGNIWTIISISEIKISQLNAISFHDFLWSTPGRQPSMAKPRVLAGKREKPWKSVKIASFNLSNGTWFFQFTRCFFWWFVWWSLLVKIGYTQCIYTIYNRYNIYIYNLWFGDGCLGHENMREFNWQAKPFVGWTWVRNCNTRFHGSTDIYLEP